MGGILTLDSDWKSSNVGNLSKSLFSLNDMERINLGCILRLGGFIIDYDKNKIEISGQNESLIHFFFTFTENVTKSRDISSIGYK